MKGDSNQIHWLAIINSIVMVLILSGIVLHILQRMLYRDIRNYNERADQDIGEDTGWK